MSTTHSISSFNGRTYGRKSSMKRKQSSQVDSQPRKRRKPEESEETDNEDPTEAEDDPLDSSHPHNHSTPDRSRLSPPHRVVKDLSGIFHKFTPTPSPQTTPTKIASRMLRRSKTDSSIDINETSQIDRTPSLPNMPSPKPSASASLEARPLAVSKPSNTRTYAGQSRSFLLSIPISSLDPLSTGQDEDEYSTRESYASLRSRWGVDDSEDDPYPDHISPARSNSRTPYSTPSKSGRNKSKAQQEASLRAQASLPNGMMNPLKSITELRNKGESRRFLDEVGYLLEGLDPNVGISLRRVSALEISIKLCNADFFRKAKAADFFNKAWDIFLQAGAGTGDDKLLDIILAFFTALVSREPACLTDMAQRSVNSSGSEPDETVSLVDTLFRLLDMPVDPLSLLSATSLPKNEAETRRFGLGKKDRALFQTIHDAIAKKSSLFPTDTLLSTPLLVLHTLQILPSALIPPKHFPTLITSLHNALPASLHPSSTSTHFSWSDSTSSMAFENIYCHLRLLDSYLLGQWEDTRTGNDQLGEVDDLEENKNETILEKARDGWLSDELVALGVCAELASGASSQKCMEVTLRVLVSLTHADRSWGRQVVKSNYLMGFILRTIVASYGGAKFTTEAWTKNTTGNGSGSVKTKVEEEVKDQLDESSADEDEIVHAIDMLCLAFGLLTNLIQVVDTMKDLLRETRIDPSCKLKKRACIQQCICNGDTVSALDLFIRIYQSYIPRIVPGKKIKSEPDLSSTPEPEMDSADAVFLRGHLAVLFGLLIRGSQENQSYILGKLGGTDAPAKLAEHARDFSTFYTALSGGNEVGQDSTVTRDIVAFLEKLKV